MDYGLEHWDNKILRNLGKGATADCQCKGQLKLHLEAGISPIPNQIIMFPDETWDSLNTMLDAWEKTNIVTITIYLYTLSWSRMVYQIQRLYFRSV